MPSKYQGSPKDRRALNAYICLLRAAESTTSRVTRDMTNDGLTVSQFSMLECLYHLGPQLASHLAKKMLKSGGNITFIMDNLEKRKLLKRKRVKNDRRATMIHLTDAGREVVELWLPRYVANIVEALGVLNPSEQKTLRELARRVGTGK